MAFWSTMNRLFGDRGKQPKATGATKPTRYHSEDRGAGMFGVAAGTEHPDKPYTAEEIAKWRMMSGKEVEQFLYDQHILHVNSTNVDKVQYLYDDHRMIVKYLDSDTIYGYGDVSEAEAISFTKEQSKGRWIWNNLRIRGTKNGHRKPMTKGDSWRRELITPAPPKK